MLYQTLHLRLMADLQHRTETHARSLDPGPNGRLTHDIERALARNSGLRATAVLDGEHRVSSILPDIPAYRAAVAQAIKRGSELTHATVVDPRDGKSLWGRVCPIGDATGDTARHVVVLVAEEGVFSDVATATALLGLVCTVSGAYAHSRLRRWFDQHVVGTLRQLSLTAYTDERPATTIPDGGNMIFKETVAIAKSMKDLRRSLSATRGHKRRVEGTVEQRLREERAGFDRKLEHAMNEATSDALTGLRNRKFLDTQLGTLVKKFHSLRKDLALVMIDLDNFKAHNDTHGHAAGDAVLRFVGRLLQSAVRQDDFAIRYGGDEFLLLLTDLSADQAAVVAERTVTLFRQYVSTQAAGAGLSMSVGIASTASADVSTADDLLDQADSALYAAKRAGKSRVFVRSHATAVPQPANVS